MERGAGHLFVVDGDLGRIDCDALLVPVDRHLNVTSAWSHLLEGLPPGALDGLRFEADSRVVRVDGPRADDARQPEIWLGDIGRTAAPESWYADGLAEFVAAACVAAGGSRHPRPVRRIAVNVAGSGLGGSAHDKGTLYRTIVPRLREAAATHGVDVALICWGAKSYSAAQRARLGATRTTVGEPSTELDRRTAERVQELADRVRRRDVVLFLGAGVSMGAGVQSWQGLLDALLAAAPDRAGVEPTALRRLDVRDQAQIIRGLYESTSDYLAALQSQLVSHPRYSLTHGLLAGLGTTENVTTNYDRLFELATRTAGRGCRVLPYDRAVAGERWLLKLHGSIEHPSDMVLTRGDYLSLPGRAGALFGLLQAMLMTKHMVFVGYSLTDDSFHRVMHEVRQVMGPEHRGEKIGTAFVLFDDPLQERLWGDVLHIVPMMERRTGDDDGPPPVAEAARRLDLTLDEIALRSADAAAFLLDASYDKLLDSDERELRYVLLAARRTAQQGSTPIHEQVVEALRVFDAPT